MMKQDKSKPSIHVCVQCGDVFETFSQLNKHRQTESHNGNSCPRCPEISLKSFTDYQKHMNEVHNGAIVRVQKQDIAIKSAEKQDIIIAGQTLFLEHHYCNMYKLMKPTI